MRDRGGRPVISNGSLREIEWTRRAYPGFPLDHEPAASMIYLFAILTAFFGGLLCRALRFRNPIHRGLAFFSPVLISMALMQIPWMISLLHAGLPPLRWETLMESSASQCLSLLFAALVAGAGWFCSYCVQSVFEEKDDETRHHD